MKKLAEISTVVGFTLFAAALVLDLALDGHPAMIVLDAALMLFFAGCAVSEFKLAPEAWRGFVKEAATLLSGAALATSFTFFALTVPSASGKVLSLGALALGVFMVAVSGSRLGVAMRVVKAGRSGEQR